MTTPEVIGIFVGIPLAICGLITAAVYAAERISVGRRTPDSTSTPGTTPPQATADVTDSDDSPRRPENTDREETT